MSGLFSTLNVSNRGMQVQQNAIDVTSHNISNASTEGYSRQKVNIEASSPYSVPSFSSSTQAGQMGTGAQVSAIERYRNSFLDLQTRVETSTNGQYDVKSKTLSQVENIFNEPSDSGLSTMMGNFFDSWQQLSKQPQSSNTRTVVAEQAVTLTDALNQTYNQLNSLKDSNVQGQIKDSVSSVDTMLNQIDKLNQQIITVSSSGNSPNDLMDKRDLLLDQLSSKFNFNIEKTSYNGINLRPVDDNGITGPYLVEAEKGQDVKRLSYVSSIEKDLTTDPTGTTSSITYYKNGDNTSEKNKGTFELKVDPTDQQSQQTLKDLQNGRVLWADNSGTAVTKDGQAIDGSTTIDAAKLAVFKPSDGELKGLSDSMQSVDEYVNQLNSMAKALAFSVNAVLSGAADASTDSQPFFVNSSTVQYNADGTVSNADTEEQGITAGNITINKSILQDVTKIKTRTNDNQFANEADNKIDGESDGTRALAVAKLRDSLLSISGIVDTSKRSDLFISNSLTNKGMDVADSISGTTIDGYFKDTIDKLGIQSQEASRMSKNQQSLLDNFSQDRESYSGVSLDEEMTNLVQFQHAYQANAKVISTVDQLLDVVINGLKK